MSPPSKVCAVPFASSSVHADTLPGVAMKTSTVWEVVFAMREPDAGHIADCMNMHRHNVFSADRGLALEGLAAAYGMATPEPHYLGAYLMGVKRHYGSFVPETPYGFPIVLPADLRRRAKWAVGAWETDGRFLYQNGRKLTAAQAKAPLLAAFRKATEKLPFRAEGEVFMQAQKVGPKTARITLVDPGFLDPADRDVTLHVRGPARRLVDILSGETIPVRSGRARLTVPAGVFRILEARM